MNPSEAPRADPLLEAFWRSGVVLFGARVQQEYALKTPFFIDLRRRLHEDLATLESLGRAIHNKIQSLVTPGCPTQQVIGIPDTATPIALSAAIVSRGSELPLLYGQLRKRPAAYPGGRSGASAYMGVADPEREITLIDDVMASGRTKLWSIAELAKNEVAVKRILVVVDREQGGDEVLEQEGYPVHCLYRASEIVAYFRAAGRIDAETAEAARRHLEQRRFSRKPTYTGLK